ncbi:hypothetical protein FRC14_002221 [Serendipita sp. 396]|nr:hypothetical protein FRC14_002221 [Serendipita sp. 396]
MARMIPLLSYISFVILLIPLTLAKKRFSQRRQLSRGVLEAWNGQGDHDFMDEYAKSHFTPYYIPEGSLSLDDLDPVIVYTPIRAWSKGRHPSLVGHTMHISSATGARADVNFHGIGIEWFGSMSAKHGIAEVYINDTLNAKVDTYSLTWLKRQRLWGVDHLPFGSHRIAIVNTGDKNPGSGGIFIDIDAFVVNPGQPQGSIHPNRALWNDISQLIEPQKDRQSPYSDSSTLVPPQWSLTQSGETGVHAMQIAVVSATHAIIIDKVEHNPLTINGHPAWGALYDLRTNEARALDIHSNSFCAGGTFLSNGSLINVGGNPVVVDRTGAADFGDLNGLQGVRLFHPQLCDEGGAGCGIIEVPHRLRLASPRWYNTVVRIDDGSALILGGSTRGGWMNNATTNNPTLEFFPPKNVHGFNGVPVPSPFLAETLNSNLFPIAFSLPDSRVFVAANRDAMIYDWKLNVERRLPQLPNGVRVTYPMTGTATLLPLTSTDNYAAVILICGGSAIEDSRPGYDIDSQEAASDQCVRMELSESGIQRGWAVEQMPQARLMPDAVLLPTGDVLIVNGAQSGIAGYGNVKNQIGNSNADHPTLTPVLYRPSNPIGSRFSSDGLPTSNIPRLYHSVASLVPDGRVMIAGSNPNLDRSSARYATEYRVEWLKPLWMDDETTRPVSTVNTFLIPFETNFTMTIDLKGGNPDLIKLALMDLGFVTHSVHMNSRLVYLDFAVEQTNDSTLTLRVKAPPHSSLYPPGPGWLYLVVGDKWSNASHVLVGDGSNPPEDPGALENMLANSNQSISLDDKASTGEGAEAV